MGLIEFEVGDRVCHKELGKGVVLCITSPFSVGVRFDKKGRGLHTLEGQCERGYGYYCLPSKLTKIGGGEEWD